MPQLGLTDVTVCNHINTSSINRHIGSVLCLQFVTKSELVRSIGCVLDTSQTAGRADQTEAASIVPRQTKPPISRGRYGTVLAVLGRKPDLINLHCYGVHEQPCRPVECHGNESVV